MKLHVACLLLCSCAQGVEDPLPSGEPIVSKPPRSASPRPEEPKSVLCDVVRVDKTSSGCTIYTLSCEGEREFAVLCQDRPIGVVTDPPRPITP